MAALAAKFIVRLAGIDRNCNYFYTEHACRSVVSDHPGRPGGRGAAGAGRRADLRPVPAAAPCGGHLAEDRRGTVVPPHSVQWRIGPGAALRLITPHKQPSEAAADSQA